MPSLSGGVGVSSGLLLLDWLSLQISSRAINLVNINEVLAIAINPNAAFAAVRAGLYFLDHGSIHSQDRPIKDRKLFCTPFNIVPHERTAEAIGGCIGEANAPPVGAA